MKPTDIQQFHARRNGTIKRRVRSLSTLTCDQLAFAEALANRYEVPLERAAKYLDWYAALYYGWIDQATFESETRV